VIVGATVKLIDETTNNERTATTDSDGRYNFNAVSPGTYKVSVAAKGFKTTVVTDVTAEVSKVATVNITLEVGDVTVTVEVAAGVEAQLQTTDASVGSVFDEIRMKRLPNINRQTNSLFALQPATTQGGEFAGSRRDQSTITLDGVDVSDNVIGQTFRTIVPVPIDAVEEFRGQTANANATFGRSAGGQLALVTKSGTNQWHGSAYFYHQDNALAANSWTNNRLGIKRPFLLDNRFGGTFGGPIFKNKTFFFLNYEGRRNPNSATVTRFVPTDSLKAGTLRFRDASGAIQTISQSAISALDPRGLGVNPKVLEYMRLFPAPNDFTQGDGLNTAGFVFSAPLTNRDDISLARLDHRVNDKWSAMAKFTANRNISTNAGQVDISRRIATGISPSRPRNAVAQITGVLNPHLTNVASFSWLHDRLDFAIISPIPFVGLNAAINLGSGTIDDIIDVDTQRARHQFRTLNIYQWSDNLTWVKSAHTIQAGGNLRRIRSVDFRDDKVVGSITTPVADVGIVGSFISIPTSQRPSFIQSADVSRYNQFYASLLGMISQVPALITRDADLKLQPLGTGLLTRSTLKAWEFYGVDTWRWKPSLTITYGLTYNWQEPPVEDSGKQTVITYKDTGKLVDFKDYIQTKLAAANAGQIFNPDIAYVPLKNAGRSTAFNTDYGDISPRFSLAWNPSFKSGWLGRMFGDRKTVIRGGYSLAFDRTNTVQTIIIPTLGVGFAQTVNVTGPKNAAGQPFRIGIDGPIPLPTAPAQISSPVVPGKPFGETLSFSVDPNIKVPRNHVVDFTIQRELPWRLLVEIGYIGRFARDLYDDGNLNSVPFMMKDPKSGQTFAQAFDAVAAVLRANATATPPPQPYFENFYGAGSTASIAKAQASAFINGNLSTLTQQYLDFLGGPVLINQQSLDLLVRVSQAISNYHGMIITVHKRFSQGLSLDANYTLSKSLDQSANLTQNNVAEFQSSFFPDISYSPSLFDIRHLFNANGSYDLPFGRNHALSFSNRALDKFISGWFMAGIFTAQSGLPLTVAQSAEAFGASSVFGATAGAIPTSRVATGLNSSITGSGGVGTNANPANKGTGLNLFADPEAAFNAFRRIRLADDRREGRGVLRGLSRWSFDWSVGKETKITERVKFSLSFDFFNVFNHVIFNDPGSLSLQNKAAFGVITSQNNTPRRIQVGARIDF
ncbi:MAG TPA: carboxypeptidase-like regulatory domain-containing protein, partial [Pyrinomonadaceae bacterium]